MILGTARDLWRGGKKKGLWVGTGSLNCIRMRSFPSDKPMPGRSQCKHWGPDISWTGDRENLSDNIGEKVSLGTSMSKKLIFNEACEKGKLRTAIFVVEDGKVLGELQGSRGDASGRTICEVIFGGTCSPVSIRNVGVVEVLAVELIHDVRI